MILNKLPPFIETSLSLKGETSRRCFKLLDQMSLWEEANKPRQRKRSSKNQKNLQESAKMLCANLIQFWNRNPEGTFGIELSKTWYAGVREKIGEFINQKGTISFLDFLIERNLVEKVSDGRKHPLTKRHSDLRLTQKSQIIHLFQLLPDSSARGLSG